MLGNGQKTWHSIIALYRNSPIQTPLRNVHQRGKPKTDWTHCDVIRGDAARSDVGGYFFLAEPQCTSHMLHSDVGIVIRCWWLEFIEDRDWDSKSWIIIWPDSCYSHPLRMRMQMNFFAACNHIYLDESSQTWKWRRWETNWLINTTRWGKSKYLFFFSLLSYFSFFTLNAIRIWFCTRDIWLKYCSWMQGMSNWEN